jgi:hypothetical protein
VLDFPHAAAATSASRNHVPRPSSMKKLYGGATVPASNRHAPCAGHGRVRC